MSKQLLRVPLAAMGKGSQVKDMNIPKVRPDTHPTAASPTRVRVGRLAEVIPDVEMLVRVIQLFREIISMIALPEMKILIPKTLVGGAMLATGSPDHRKPHQNHIDAPVQGAVRAPVGTVAVAETTRTAVIAAVTAAWAAAGRPAAAAVRRWRTSLA